MKQHQLSPTGSCRFVDVDLIIILIISGLISFEIQLKFQKNEKYNKNDICGISNGDNEQRPTWFKFEYVPNWQILIVSAFWMTNSFHIKSSMEKKYLTNTDLLTGRKFEHHINEQRTVDKFMTTHPCNFPLLSNYYFMMMIMIVISSSN